MAENTLVLRTQHIPTRHTQLSTGSVTYDGTAIVADDYTEVVVGYRPRRVEWTNAANGVQVVWYEDMEDDVGIKTAADGARTTLTEGGITVTDGGFRISQSSGTAAVVADSTCHWVCLA